MNIKHFGNIVKCAAAVMAAVFFTGLLITLNRYEAQTEVIQEVSDELTYFKNFTLYGIDGEQITQDDLKGYKVTVFNAWAPWCVPCVGEMPYLEKLSNEYHDKGIQVVGVVADYYPAHAGKSDGYDDSIREIEEQIGVTYPIVVADEAFHSVPYVMLNSAVPGTWAVDENGNLIEFFSGDRSEEEWRECFDKWLEGR